MERYVVEWKSITELRPEVAREAREMGVLKWPPAPERDDAPEGPRKQPRREAKSR